MDMEKVIKGLEICYYPPSKCEDCPYHDLPDEQSCNDVLCLDALALLKKQEATKWISTAERLPKSNPEDLEYPTVIIALEDGTVELGCFYESTQEWGAGENFDRLRKPVAWMPLPEAPAKGGEVK